ncbi:hypothetical protein BSKO_05749 [Bryopsis sp. KO-2023]|nr:hypothetical protein BSKO_05749 [Bryopsis sp. KO-2023]
MNDGYLTGTTGDVFGVQYEEEPSLSVLLHFPVEASVDFESCPVQASGTQRPCEIRIPTRTQQNRSTSRKNPNLINCEEGKVLGWFKKQCDRAVADNPAVDVSGMYLMFPTDMDKFQRRHWHHLADMHDLISESKGVGAERMLRIYPNSFQNQRPMLEISADNMQYAKDVWRACQLEGHDFAWYSQGELEELLCSEGGLPQPVQDVYHRRLCVRDLINKIKDEDYEGCRRLIESSPSIVLLKDDDSPGFPIHVACFIGARDIVNCMIQNLPNEDLGAVCDKNGRSAILVAEHFGYIDIARDLARNAPSSYEQDANA